MSLLSEVEALLQDDDLGVRTEVIYLLYLKAGNQGRELLKDYLNHVDPRLQTAAVACLAEHQLAEARELLDEDRLEVFLVRTDSDAETGRVEVAKLLGILPGDHYRVFLAQLLADSSPVVESAAILSCGRRRDPDFLEPLIQRLKDYRFRAVTKDALADYGKSMLPLFSQRLLDSATNASIRRNLPGVIWRIRDPESVQTLFRAVRSTPPSLRFFVVKGLNKLHRAVPNLRIDSKAVQELIFAEIADFDRNQAFMYELAASELNHEMRCIIKALKERCALSLELVFRLLGLIHPTSDILGAYWGVVGNRENSRSSAIEYLDNYLQGELRWRLLTVIEQWTELRRSDPTARPAPVDVFSVESTLLRILEVPDPWLQTLALACAAPLKSARFKAIAPKFLSDPDEFLSETAQYLLNQ